MKLTKSCFVFLILGVLVLTGCYGSPAFEGDVTVGKEGQTDVGSEEPCIGEFGKAILSWSDTQEQVPTLTKYTLKYGVIEGGPYSNIIDLPPTGGVDFTGTMQDEEGNDVEVDMQKFEYELNDLERGYTYYFIMTASNTHGESAPSEEVFKTFDICPQINEDPRVQLK